MRKSQLQVIAVSVGACQLTLDLTALTHARKMEVVAQRKKNNLELEELVNNTQKRDAALKKQEESSSSMTIDAYEQLKDDVLDKQLKVIEDSAKAMQEQMSAFLDEMDDEQSEMLREMSEMLDAVEIVDPHMNEQQFNKLKLKHRLAENKALMKADMDYLKGAMSNHTAVAVPGGIAGMGFAGGFTGGMGAFGPGLSLSGISSAPAAEGMSSESGTGVDVSV